MTRQVGRSGVLKTRRTTIIFSVLAVATITAYTVFRTAVLHSRIPGIGDEAPDFHLPGLYGDDVTLTGLKGIVVFINFWATWCPPCRDEIPSLVALHKRFKGRPFRMIAVSVDREGGAVVKKFLEKGRYDLPVFLDPGGDLAFEYGTVKYPETFVVGADGTVREKFIGPFDWMDDDIVAKIEVFVVEAEGRAGAQDQSSAGTVDEPFKGTGS